MGSNTTTEQAERVQRIIDEKYKKEQHILELSWDWQINGHWIRVLMSRNWTTLVTLKLDYNQIGDSGAELVGGLHWPNLRSLDITGNEITGTGISQLLRQKFPQMKQIQLYNNEIGDEGMCVLSVTQSLPLLQELQVGRNSITWLGLALMPDSSILFLKKVYLYENKIGSRGVKLLIKAALPLLQSLDLSFCYLGSEGAKHISKGNWPNLLEMGLDANQINYDGCSAVTSNCWKKLTYFSTFYSWDRTGPAAALNLLSASWSSKMRLSCRFKSRIRRDVRYIVQSRYNQGQEDESDKSDENESYEGYMQRIHDGDQDEEE